MTTHSSPTVIATWQVHTSLGVFTLEADEHGLCALLFPGENSQARPNPGNERDTADAPSPLLKEAASQLLAYLDGRLFAFDLPLSYCRTAFQKHVWQGLMDIPYGETMSYGELATQLGNRNKARAVGGAAHANPIGIIIPCHRLIGASGALTGFGGGLDMKETLLSLEQKYQRK